MKNDTESPLTKRALINARAELDRQLLVFDVAWFTVTFIVFVGFCVALAVALKS